MLEARVSRPFFVKMALSPARGLKNWTARQVNTVPPSLLFLLCLVPGKGQTARTSFACPEGRGASQISPSPLRLPSPHSPGLSHVSLHPFLATCPFNHCESWSHVCKRSAKGQPSENSNRGLCFCTPSWPNVVLTTAKARPCLIAKRQRAAWRKLEPWLLLPDSSQAKCPFSHCESWSHACKRSAKGQPSENSNRGLCFCTPSWPNVVLTTAKARPGLIAKRQRAA